jgi:hypothetical protein
MAAPQTLRARIKETLRFSGYVGKTTIVPDTSYSPPGWYADHPVFEQVVSVMKPTLILDVGSLWGASCVRMARLAKEASLSHEVTVVAIDTWLGSMEHYLTTAREEYQYGNQYGNSYERFCENIVRSGVADLVIPFPQTSVTAAQILAHFQIQPDLIYIDASHDYRNVLADLEIYWKLLRMGGVLFGDDFGDPWYGVIRAVLEFAEKIGVPFQLSKAYASGPDGEKQLNCKYVFQKRSV